MKAFMPGLNNRYGFGPNLRADRTQVAGFKGIRVNHARIGTHVTSAILHQLVLLEQSPRRSGKREPKLTYAITSAMTGGISRGNAQLGLKKR